MAGETTEDALLELKLVGDIAGSFRVARYQRGYRWGKLEVEQLLNDIWESKGEPYSLQPVVVKRDGELAWELIDGQQRLTTLYLIFVYLQRAGLKNVGPQYAIEYDTRQKSRDYLQTLDPALADSNIDFFHLHAAYACIEAWFDQKGPTPLKKQEVADDIFRYLCKSVRVIWYEVPRGMDSTTLFTRLNVGRIPLTDAELFKALLLSRSDRAHEIAAQWDSIERDLQHPDVWAFVADDVNATSPTRINLLLDTVAGDPEPSDVGVARGRTRPRFYTFDALRAKVEQGSLTAVWEQVVDLHALVLGWYESRDWYHKVGYLVAVGQRFSALVALAKDRTKRSFGALLEERICHTLDLSPSGVTELSYESDANKCARVLLLMNVETVRRLKGSTERYSFSSHRLGAWSLEHIHAQQAEGLTKAEQWKEWLRLHHKALKHMPDDEGRPAMRSALISRIDAAGDQIDRQTFQALEREVSVFFSASTSTTAHSVHSVSNLALLKSDHNSALNNAAFEVKRKRILELDRTGAYVPVCTRQVFLKYYAGANAQQVHFWGPQDREAYLNAILSTDVGVGNYLKLEELLT